MRKQEYIQHLKDLLFEDESMAYGEPHETIYQIDDLTVYGGFYGGVRSIDHNELKSDDVTWEEILTWGTLVVPETESYISDVDVEEFDAIGFSRLPLESNHIVGFKN